MAKQITLPDLGEGIDSAAVLDVLVEPGQSIQAEQDILEVETDKASVTIPSPHSGVVQEIHVSAGDTVEEGSLLLTLEEADGDTAEPSADDAGKDSAEAEEQTPPQAEAKEESEPAETQESHEPEPQKQAFATSPSSAGGSVQDVALPDLGEGVDSGEVINIFVEAGQQIEAEQDILEVETDKASVAIPSPMAGEVTDIHVSQGQSVSPGDVLLSVRASGGEAEKTKPQTSQENKQPSRAKAEPKPEKKSGGSSAEKAPKADEQPAEEKSTAGRDVPQTFPSNIPAGPAVRRLARELGVDLRRVKGTGSGGRIQREDVFAAIRDHNIADGMTDEPTALQPAKPNTDEASATEDAWGKVNREPISRLRATVAKKMQESKSTIPHVTHFDRADVTELETFRRERKADLEEAGVKLTMMPFLLRAVVECLRKHPKVNATLDLDAGEILFKQYISIGVAVDTPRGLVVPVLRNVDTMSIADLARGLQELASRARKNDYAVDDLRGGTFTISNQGAVGGAYATPVINAPESAILLLGRSEQTPVVRDGEIVIRTMLPLSFSYDHRLIDGADAGRFVNDLKGFLEFPGKLLLTL